MLSVVTCSLFVVVCGQMRDPLQDPHSEWPQPEDIDESRARYMCHCPPCPPSRPPPAHAFLLRISPLHYDLF